MDKAITPKEYFRCKNGVSLTSLVDLEVEFRKYSEGMALHDYKFHSQNKGNDYANWVEVVFNQPKLAEQIRQENEPAVIMKLLEDFNKPAEKKLKKDNEKKLESYDDHLLDKAEAMTLRLKELKKRTQAPLSSEEKGAKLIEAYDLLYSDISQNRKHGKDMFIPGLLIKNLKPKIKYYQASGDESDYKAVMRQIDDIRKEIKEALNKVEPDLEAEIMAIVNKDVSKKED